MSNQENRGSFGNNTSSYGNSPEDQHRIELLKLQREVQRREKERAAWRAASETPGVFGSRVPPKEESDSPSAPIQRKRGESSFFAKLRLGRLLDK